MVTGPDGKILVFVERVSEDKAGHNETKHWIGMERRG
jgi:hypothetical protein